MCSSHFDRVQVTVQAKSPGSDLNQCFSYIHNLGMLNDGFSVLTISNQDGIEAGL